MTTKQLITEGCLYMEGLNGYPKNLERAITLFQSAADRGDPFAQFNLGLALRDLAIASGDSLLKRRAEGLFSQAAWNGCEEAMVMVGMSLSHSSAERLRWLCIAAASENPHIAGEAQEQLKIEQALATKASRTEALQLLLVDFKPRDQGDSKLLKITGFLFPMGAVGETSSPPLKATPNPDPPAPPPTLFCVVGVQSNRINHVSEVRLRELYYTGEILDHSPAMESSDEDWRTLSELFDLSTWQVPASRRKEGRTPLPQPEIPRETPTGTPSGPDWMDRAIDRVSSKTWVALALSIHAVIFVFYVMTAYRLLVDHELGGFERMWLLANVFLAIGLYKSRQNVLFMSVVCLRFTLGLLLDAKILAITTFSEDYNFIHWWVLGSAGFVLMILASNGSRVLKLLGIFLGACGLLGVSVFAWDLLSWLLRP